MKRILPFFVFGMLLGTGLGAQSSDKSEYQKGEDLFNDKCHLCHGKRGDGNGPAAVAFSPRPANFTDPKFWQNFNEAMIADTIRKGHGMMPAFDLAPDQIKAIIDYMEHTFKKGGKGSGEK
jgi:mono/diheme cytochrome c family protein